MEGRQLRKLGASMVRFANVGGSSGPGSGDFSSVPHASNMFLGMLGLLGCLALLA